MSTVPERIIGNAAAAGKRVAAAESLTAGMVAAELGTVAGASAVLQGGVVAYQNSVKEQVLGVDGALLAISRLGGRPGGRANGRRRPHVC